MSASGDIGFGSLQLVQMRRTSRCAQIRCTELATRNGSMPMFINRLMNMGIEPFLVASSVHLICAQRLVRRICTSCKEPHQLPAQALEQAGFSKEDANAVTPMKGVGCEKCNKTGYKG